MKSGIRERLFATIKQRGFPFIVLPVKTRMPLCA